MANKKISQLDALGAAPAATDILPITDVSDTTGSAQGTTKRVTVANLHSGLQAEPAEGAFVDGDKTKLDGIEASADVTDATNVQAAGALMDSEVTNLAEVKAFSSADYATAAQGTTADSAVQPTDSINVLADVDTSTVSPADGQALVWDNTAGQWEPGPAGASNLDDLSDVDTSTTTPTTNDFLKWGGSNWVPAVPTADVDTPLNLALRGTANPHIGAYPNQPFNALENSAQSVMVVTNSAGELDFLIPDGGNLFLNSPSGGRVAPSFGFSVSQDANEPDIEVAGTLVGSPENYSVISGDSDSVGLNGLPMRQGFNNPDIGANPAPILISGGSIA
jgi:hypothetical protein